MTIILYTRI